MPDRAEVPGRLRHGGSCAAGLGDGEDPADADIDDEDLEEALAWAEAGVCVLQLSLPWPFTDCLPYGEPDNRPARRVLYPTPACSPDGTPRKAAPWYRAMVYYNPLDNMGARFSGTGSVSSPSTSAW
jgi:hypothetical protein